MILNWLRRGAASSLLAVVACAAPAGLAGTFQFTQEPAAAPQERALSLAPLSANEVRIVWDGHGIPHIAAASDEAGFFGFGWAQMETRPELVLDLYVRARGEAAAINGAAAAQSDVLMLSLGVPERAEAWLAQLRPETRARLTAFVDGMNAWIKANPERIPDRLRPAIPVRDTDPLAHLHQIVHVAFISGEVLEDAAEDFDESPGSNAYAIAPSRSASGHAMLVANPHLPWSDLFTWTELHLAVPSFDIYGVALTGAPFVGIGFTEHGGWTHTVNEYDGIDVYDLVLEDGGYRLDGDVRAFTTKTISFDVRQADGSMEPVTHEVKHSEHGPVLFEDDQSALAVRIAAWDSFGMLDQYFDMAAAQSLAEFEAAQARLQMPFFNTFYANQDGDIYYLHGGRVPARSEGDWAFWRQTVPGDDTDLIWSDYLPYEALPRLTNPDAGFLQNANEPPWYVTWPQVLAPSDYAPFIASTEQPWFRTQHSLRSVLEDTSITFDELVDMKQTNQLEMAVRFKDQIVDAARGGRDADAQAGADILAAWDGSTDADSRGAILFMEWADLAFDAPDETDLFAEGSTADYPFQTPALFQSPDLAAQYLAEAVAVVRARHGDPAVAYGEFVRVRRGDIDLPGSGGEGWLGAYRVAHGRLADDGVRTITHGDSFVAVIEFGERVTAVGNLSYGNTDDPDSPYFGMDLQLFSESQLRPLHYYPSEILAAATTDETLSVSRD